jgi:FkbH-like protein
MTTLADNTTEATDHAALHVAICANFVAEPLEEPLQYWLGEMGVASSISFAPYNQVYQQLLDPSSLLAKNRNGLNVILVRLEEWCRNPAFDQIDETLLKDRASELKRNVQDFLAGVMELRKRHTAPLIVVLCPNSPSISESIPVINTFREVEELMNSELSRISSLEWVPSHTWTSLYPAVRYHDHQGDLLAHIPYTSLLYSTLSMMITRRFHKLKFPPRKVIVLDCDNTLWSGVVGEDGPEGICIDPPRKAFQEHVLKQQRRGMLVALCSKNNEQEVFQVFDTRSDMVLKRQHVVSTRINWNSKSENLMSISQELGLALDSFVFFDDDPIVCAEVRAHLPEVLTFLLPASPTDIPAFLQHLWVFDHDAFTDEDRQRTQLYQEHFMRERVRRESQTLKEFLANLDLVVEISRMAAQQVQRVSELTIRTNQFNTTGIKRLPLEVGHLLGFRDLESLVVCAKDRFGDYGLVGVVVHKTERDSLLIDTFLLSCRALGRGVEHQVVAYLGAMARQRDLKTVNIVCIPSPKNLPAVNFLESLQGAIREYFDDRIIFQLSAEVAAATTYSPNGLANNDECSDGESTVISSSPKERLGTAILNTFLASVSESLRDAPSIHDRFTQFRARSSPVPITASPRTPVETRIAAVFCELLGLDAIDVHDGFFDLGGHSLIAMQVLSRLNGEFNVELTPILLFTSKFAVVDLADAVVQQQLKQLDTDEVESIFQKLSELTNEQAEKLYESDLIEDLPPKQKLGH